MAPIPIFRHCFNHLLISIWRKRPFLLALVMVATLVVVAFQYHSVNGTAPSPSGKGFDLPNGMSDGDIMVAASMMKHQSFVGRRNLSGLNKEPTGSNTIHDTPSTNTRTRKGPPTGSHHRSLDEFRNQDLMSTDLRNERHPSPEEGASRGLVMPSQDGVSAIGGGDSDSIKNGVFVPHYRVAHLDLKGAPPKISYFKQIFPLIKEAGANAILLEYEDMFPFWGSLKPIASPAAYSRDDILAIIELAKIHDFELIPLVQTFGHLEFALKLEEFRSLREVDIYPMAICPSRNESVKMVTQMVDQIMMIHSTSKWLHIGCDEVYHMGYCDRCRSRDRDSIFLGHVTKIAKYVRDKYNVIPIIWDDMLRNMSPDRMKELGTLVEPMVWSYVKDVYRFIPYSTWLSFSEVFPHVWGASSFKGAYGETLTIPNAKMHLENNEGWIEVMTEQHKNFKSIRGIVVTGWQRYDHLGTLCETLPAGLPSLILNLLTLNSGRFEGINTFKRFDKILQCTSRNNYYSISSSEVDLDKDPFLWHHGSTCIFPGSSVFRLTQHTSDAVKRVNDYIYDVTIHKAWMTDFNVRHNLTNPMRVDEALTDHAGIYYALTSLVREAEEALKEVFDKYTVSEWIEQNIYPYLVKMERVMKDAVELKKARTWPRRPLPPLEDIKRFRTAGSDL